MSKLQITYDAAQEIETIIKLVEQHVDMKKDEKETYDVIQKMFQSAFEEGRKFQKQISLNSGKDSLVNKCDI